MAINHVRVFLIIFLFSSTGILGALGHSARCDSLSTDTANPINQTPLSSSTIVYVDPQNITGDLFTINVNVTDVTNLYGFTIRFVWGSKVLEYVSRTVSLGNPGWLLNKPNMKIKDDVDETAGTYSLSATSIAPAPSFNGSGLAFQMTFARVAEGECSLYLHSTDLWNKAIQPIPHESRDGYFYWPGKGNVPEADFTISPEPPYTHMVTNRTRIVFNASDSYDPDAGGAIVEYYWDFGDGNLTTTYEPVVTHMYFAPRRPEDTARGPWTYFTSLSVLDVEGSQSRIKYSTLQTLHPRPVSVFNVSESVLVVGQEVFFDASESYDMDPPELGGGITEYRWVFGDGEGLFTTDAIVSHRYMEVGKYAPTLVIVDSEGFTSDSTGKNLNVVAVRDIDVAAVEVSPTEVPRGSEALIKATIVNRGDADETLNVTAYYNQTAINWADLSATEWFRIDEKSITTDASLNPLTRYLLTKPGTANTIDCLIGEYLEIGGGAGQVPTSTDTKVKVGDVAGYWTINPNKTNDATPSQTLVAATPLSTGGWIRDAAQKELDPVPLDGDFAEGNWTFSVRLFATEPNVEVAIWVRILKSDNPDPQNTSALVTVVKDWTQLFEPTLLPTTVQTFNGTITLPILAFHEEYLYVEYQLHVTDNESGSATTEVIFQVNDYFALIMTPPFTLEQNKKTLTFNWDTSALTPEKYYWILVNASRVPQEVKTANNIRLSDEPVHITLGTPIASFNFSPAQPIVGEYIRFDASSSLDPNGYITEYIWDFGDGILTHTISPSIDHTYDRPDVYNVTLQVIDNDALEDSETKWVQVSISYPLDLMVDVGVMHFGGEIAEFYVLVLRSGERINATGMTAVLYHSNGAEYEDLSSNKQLITTGLYRINFNIDPDAPSGTYTLLVEARYLSLKGTAIKSFLISPKLKGWDARLTNIENEVATIIIPDLGQIKANLTEIKASLVRIEDGLGIVNSTLGEIKADLTALNATLTDIVVTANGEVLAQITYYLGSSGTIMAKLDTINAKVVAVDGSLINIRTDVGNLKTDIGGIQGTVATPLYLASIFSAIATILAIIILLTLRRKRG